MNYRVLAAFASGVVVTLAVSQGFQEEPGVSGDLGASPPDAIGGPRSDSAKVDAMDIDLGDWRGWFIHSPNGYRQVAFSMPGQPGVLVGELYDDSGVPVGNVAAQMRERSTTSLASIERLSSWVSHDFPYPPSLPEVQAKGLATGEGVESAYLLADPFSENSRQHSELIESLIDSGLRVVPVANSGASSYDGLHAIMEPGFLGGADQTSLDVFLLALKGGVVPNLSGPGMPEHERAFMAFSKNISLQSRLGIQTTPVVIHAAKGDGIEVTGLETWAALQGE